jgi:asparagine synthase (glutamine-hydrolysing)
MAVALEARAPLLDVNVFAYCWSLPLSMKIRNGKGKWVLRELLARHLPRDLFERPKQGFGMPVAEWLRGDLREWAETLLAPDRLGREGYLEPKPVRRAWSEHLEGRNDHSTRLWCILMFQAWAERWMH